MLRDYLVGKIESDEPSGLNEECGHSVLIWKALDDKIGQKYPLALKYEGSTKVKRPSTEPHEPDDTEANQRRSRDEFSTQNLTRFRGKHQSNVSVMIGSPARST
jgi:hypothetical protein